MSKAHSSLTACFELRITGKTKVHVAAVSSGDPTPYPNVNNTQRWQALQATCPYSFTILGRNEPWIGDKGVTKNKLMYYAKCEAPSP